MTWIYSGFAHSDWAWVPAAVPCGGVAAPVSLSQAGLATPGAVGITHTQGLSSQPPLALPSPSPQECVCFVSKSYKKKNKSSS